MFQVWWSTRSTRLHCTQRQRQALIWQRKQKKSRSKSDGKGECKEGGGKSTNGKGSYKVKTLENWNTVLKILKTSSETHEFVQTDVTDDSYRDNSLCDDGWSYDEQISVGWNDGRAQLLTTP